MHLSWNFTTANMNWVGLGGFGWVKRGGGGVGGEWVGPKKPTKWDINSTSCSFRIDVKCVCQFTSGSEPPALCGWSSKY